MSVRRRLDSLPSVVCGLGLLLTAGCSSTSVTSELPVAGRILPPDRMVVHRFQTIPQGSEYRQAPTNQSPEEVRIGRALAEAIAQNLVAELRARGITANLAREDAPPEDNTIVIYGRFMHLEPGTSNVVGGYILADPLRSRVMIFQGSGSYIQFIAQADTATRSTVKAGMAPAAEKAAIDTDAKVVAKESADRIADYYRKHGLMK